VPGVLVKIRSLYSSLPKAERQVADFIQGNPEKAPHRSVHEFARAGGVSVASVSRFVRKLGFSDFKEFKLELARETTGTVQTLFHEITPTDSDEEISRKVFLGNIKSLEDTLKMVSFPELTQAARAICACHRMVFFGIGGSGYVGHDAALRFSHLDFQAEAYEDPSRILLQSLRMGPGDVAIGISHSGRSAITVEGMRIAREKGALTVGISNYLRSPLRDTCGIFFCTSFPENKVKVAAISSKVAQLCLLDALYLLVARHKEGLWDVEQVNSLTERMIRLKTRNGAAGGR
jgi:RpiR family transcriptional regulator, carbohydrate utilization regulator